MVFEFIRQTIAKKTGIENPKMIGLDFSLIDEDKLSVDDFYVILEEIEGEMDINLVDHAWKFDTVRSLVEYIEVHK